MKRQATDREKIFQKTNQLKDYCLKYAKNSLKLSSKKSKQTDYKIGQKTSNRNLTKGDIQVTNKYIKICSISYVMKEMQSKTTMGCHYTLLKMTKIQNTDNQMLVRTWSNKNFYIHCWEECRMVQSLLKADLQFLIKVNIHLPYYPMIPLLGSYPKELKTSIHTKSPHGCL